VPYTVQRIEYAEQVEQIPVRTCRYVNETKAVQVPRTVGKWVAYQTTVSRPRIVTMRVDLTPSNRTIIGTPTYAAPAPTLPTRVVPSTQTQLPAANGTTSGGVRSGTTTKTTPSTGTTGGSSSGSPTPAKGGERSTTPGGTDTPPRDSDETGRPDLNSPSNTRSTSYDRSA
jgi:hypothetical protein